jgi:3-dehydroquinate synthase
VLTDETSRYHCYERIKDQLPAHRLIVIPSGERHKNLDTCRSVWQQMTEAGLDRHSVLLAVGGGVVGDLGGFCASTFKRGIDFVLVPTTLLAMADASIGGKTGIDLGPLKNHLGTFAQPAATWIATQFLETLPRSELRSGFAEIIKHAILSDRVLWKAITRKPLERQDWVALVKKSVTFKSSVVKKDPRERGLRKILNFGHTMGHALEGYALASDKPIMHGEAVAAGMVMEAFIAWKKKMLPEAEFREIRAYILQVFGQAEVPTDEKWLDSISQDKKNRGNEIRMALPRRIGKAEFDIPVSAGEIRAAAANYRKNQM